MNFDDESYVRLYPRRTLTNRRLKWQGRAVMHAMLGEFDRVGVFAHDGDAAECISLVTEIPLDVARAGLERLVETETWIVTGDEIIWPSYHRAQTCARSDRTRQAESRARRAADAAARGQTTRPPRRSTSRPVTSGHDTPSRAVTGGHEPPSAVTPNSGLAIPSLARDPDRARAREVDESADADELAPLPGPERPEDGRARDGAHDGPRDAGEAHAGQREAAPALVTSYPRGWRWSDETRDAAAREGLTEADLAEHVEYWTLHHWRNPVDRADLDAETRRQLTSIKDRVMLARRNGFAAEPIDRYAWHPDQAARAFCTERNLDLRFAADAYRKAGTPERLGSLIAHDDFLARLRCWADTGQFIASGPRPRKRRPPPAAAEDERGAA